MKQPRTSVDFPVVLLEELKTKREEEAEGTDMGEDDAFQERLPTAKVGQSVRTL